MVRSSSRHPTRRRWAATALGLLGRPYAFGGATPDGFDSSGFTHYVHAQHGVELPRVAAQQYRGGTPVVRRDDLRPGDLVFFDPASPIPSNVGLAIGDGRFVYASAALGEVRADHFGTKPLAPALSRRPARRRSAGGWDARVARHRPKRVVRGEAGSSLRRLRP